MKYLKIPFLLIWRSWFYILMFASLLVLSPFLFVFSFKEEHYHYFWKVSRIISKTLIYGMGFRLDFKAEENIEPDKSYMFCPNHASLMDPFVLIAISKNPIVFVGKKELVKIPVFGFFYKRVVIMVDRSSAKSRKRVYKMAKQRLQNGVSMAIFPEGLVPAEDVVLAPFKRGAFGLAIEYQIPVVPQIYYDCKRFFSWDFLKGRPGVLRIHQHKFIKTKELKEKDIDALKEQTFRLMYNDLINDKEYMKDTNRKK
ncbi:1-acyl-sn-glycerol-3-phosphate acyltransferase [Polaribacter batillariae]|uniref:1-acyl-sn-glycerol-3-phosphate acyltransferase n=1 Tax=Polaribacter batillariae TaxID=2808900 RepID=A0ABX7SQU3_9FLAO|nr:lysophospholipid acyltransferase family protein [Polaribacter batillariae]QTD36607.1 1-acyl-sn-glycerol-3-phosphate acyltransferase [Polaribacter batillariae]